MRSRVYVASVVIAVLIAFAPNPSIAKESRKLAAPIYPGAVPAVSADGLNVNSVFVLTFDGGKTLDCAATTVARDLSGREIAPEQAGPVTGYTGPWCFLTRDPIDKVKAFYEKSIGKLQAVQGENGLHGFEAFTERAWIEGGDSPPGYGHIGVSVHALGPPPVKGQAPTAAATGDDQWTGQEDYKFYAQTRFFGGFIDAIDFFGDPSKRPISDLDALYKNRNTLESALFQLKGPQHESVDAALTKQYGDLMGQRQQAAMMGTLSSQMQQNASAPSAEPPADEDARINKAMANDPALQKHYVELTQKVQTLMMQGKMDEADAVMDEIDAMEAANPELAALNSEEEARSAEISAQNAAADKAIQRKGASQLDQAVWGTGLEMLDALGKEAYYTLIVIDNGYDESQKGFSQDRGVIDAETAGMLPHDRVDAWNIRYEATGPTVTASGGTQQAAPEEKEKEKESVKDKAKKGLSKLLGH
jgi:hypothetical protein